MAKTIQEVKIETPTVTQEAIKTPAIESGEQAVTRRTALIFSVASFALSLFFLSRDVTGEVIGNLNLDWMNLVGAVLFILAMLGFLYYFRTRKSAKKKKKK